MGDTDKRCSTVGQEWLFCQEKAVFLGRKQKKLVIGIPNELEKGENRVCLTPESVQILVSMGHTLFVQRGAGGRPIIRIRNIVTQELILLRVQKRFILRILL